MPSKFKRYRAGDEFTSDVLNTIFDELDRLRGMSGTGLISVDSAGGHSPPIIVDHRGAPLLPAQLTATLATGTIASPTSATATLLLPTGTSGALTATGGSSITVLNTLPLTASLASGTQIWVTSFAGSWYLNQAGCP